MVCDWLKSLWIQRKYFQRPPGHSTLFCIVALFSFQKFGLVHIHCLRLMALLFETSRCFSKPETFPSTSYLEILSGEQAEMLVSMLSELSRLRVSKAWSL